MKILLLLILTAILWGSTPILDKIGLVKVSPLTAVTVRSTAVMLVLLLFLLVTGKFKSAVSVDLKTALILGASGVIAGLLAMLTYFTALKHGATSKIVPIAATYPLFSAIFSIMILGEQVTLFRVIGTVLIVSGIWFVRL